MIPKMKWVTEWSISGQWIYELIWLYQIFKYICWHVFSLLCFSSNTKESVIDESLVVDLIEMIDNHNVLAKSFRRVRDLSLEHMESDFTLRLFRGINKDPKVYNTPSCDEIVALIVGDFGNMDVGREI